jgi:hypothetical protein
MHSSTEVDPGTRNRWALIALNAALLVALGAVTFGPSASAQARVRATYTMAAGRAEGARAGVVYVADVTNQELIAFSYDPDTKTIVGIAHRDLAGDAANLGSGPDR